MGENTMAFLTITDIFVFLVGLLLLGFWLVMYFRGKKNEQLFQSLDQSDYPMGDTYFVGYEVTQLLKLDYRNKTARRLRKKLTVLYEPKYADYYIRVVYSMQYTMALTIACLAAPMYFLSGSLALFVFVLFGAVGVYYYYGVSMDEKLKQREERILTDFSEVVSKLALLVNSGMIMNEAWRRVAFSGETTIYQEMRRSVDEMQNGESAVSALYEFGQRCMLPEIKKFSTTLIQGVTQGNKELAAMLTQQSKEVWELKKQLVRRQGELANNKLLLPMCVTFVGILIMVMIPIFANLGT